MYKHIVFDFDGTLVDSAELMFKIFNDLAEKYHFCRFTQDEFKRLNKLSFKKKFRLFLFMLQRRKEFKCIYKEKLASIMLFDGIEELLYKLKESGFIISVITSNSADNISDFLKLKGLGMIEDVQSSKGFGKSRALKKYLKKHRLDNTEIIYIGDELRDIKACNKLNIDIISVTWGLDSKDCLQSANKKYIIDECCQISDILCTL